MKTLTAHQPAYLPWLGLFHKISLADIYVFMDDRQYSTNDKYINKNYVFNKNKNQKHLLSVPLKTKGSMNINIFDVLIDNSQEWQYKHFETIRHFYNKSRFYDEIIKFLEPFYNRKYYYFSDLAYDMLQMFLKILSINTIIIKASDMNIFSNKNQYLIDICKKTGSERYIFGEQGKKYIDKSLWEQNNIECFIQSYVHPVYPQKNNCDGFVSHLSIIDLLFNVGMVDAKKIIFRNNIKNIGECEKYGN